MATTNWSFTTAPTTPPPSGCPCSLWPNTAVPNVAADPDPAAVELGVKFRSDVAGTITGIRFYKAATNTGTHTGAVWAADGTKLGSVTFSGETASGWQQASFTTPIPIAANTTYVASYRAPNGHYAVDEGFFATAGVDRGPLHALRDGLDGANGVYAYGALSVFPQSSYQASNYWVDVVFAAPS